VPQLAQNLAFGPLTALHEGQVRGGGGWGGATAVPQLMQNFAEAGFCEPHLAHATWPPGAAACGGV
jgi:hypothetical protein